MRHISVAILTFLIVFAVPLLASSSSSKELSNTLSLSCVMSDETLFSHHHTTNTTSSDYAMLHSDGRSSSSKQQPDPMAIPLVAVPKLPNADSIVNLPKTASNQLSYIIALFDLYIAAACLETQLNEMGVVPVTPLPKLTRSDYIPSKDKLIEI
jgi:hypothetical protein